MTLRARVAGALGQDRGSGTIAAIGVLLVAAALVVVVATAGAARAAASQARSVADLSALAGAEALARGGDACAVVAETAQASGAVVVACEQQGQDVGVRVRSAPLEGAFAVLGGAAAGARAGPSRLVQACVP